RRNEFLQNINASYRTFDRLAQVAISAGKLDEIERMFRGNPNPKLDFFRVANDSALIELLRQTNRYLEIRNLCLRRIANADHDHVAINQFFYRRLLVDAHIHLGELDEAQKVNDEAMADAHNDDLFVSCRLNRAELLYRSGKVNDSLVECDQLLKEYPQRKFAK